MAQVHLKACMMLLSCSFWILHWQVLGALLWRDQVCHHMNWRWNLQMTLLIPTEFQLLSPDLSRYYFEGQHISQHHPLLVIHLVHSLELEFKKCFCPFPNLAFASSLCFFPSAWLCICFTPLFAHWIGLQHRKQIHYIPSLSLSCTMIPVGVHLCLFESSRHYWILYVHVSFLTISTLVMTD